MSAATTDDRPTVSVVIPTYFRNDRLRTALDSVETQTLDDVETVVVDDSGECHAESVAAEYDVPYVGFERNRGANIARTIGARETTGRYVQFLDDDDELKPEKLERQVELLEDSPDVGVVYCGMDFEDGRQVLPDPEVRGDVLGHALAFTLYPCQTTTMLAEREVVEDAIPWKNRPGADDFGRMIELARRTKFDFVDEPLVYRGVIQGSRGKSMGVYHGRLEIVAEYEELYERFPDRVRATALADTYRFRGQKLLQERPWSPGAVAAFGRAAAHEPSPYNAGLAISSLLGRPGIRLGSRAYARLDG